MASRKRGTVQVRGRSISVVLDLGEQPWRRCPTPRCPGSVFTDSRAPMRCERCGAALADPVPHRRRVWHSGFQTKSAANKALTTLLGATDTGTFVEPSILTVRQFVEDQWLPGLESGNLRPTTIDLYRRSARLYILPRLGSFRLRDLTPAAVVQWLTTLKGAETGARTVELAGTTLHRILASAVDLELIPRNPCDNKAVREARPRAKAPKPTVWTPEQTAQFLASEQADRLYPLWRLAATTGLRRGELCGLRWSGIDLDGGSLTVSGTRVVVGWDVLDSGPKTASGGRVIGLDGTTVAALRTWKAQQSAERLAAGELWHDTTDYVFTNELGVPIHPGTVTRTLASRARALGLPPIRVHALRHGHATHALEAGVPLPVISKRLGHASIRITADTYSHVSAAVDQAAADQVAALLDRGA